MNRNILSGIDWFLVIPVAILVLISLVTLFSVNPIFFQSQLIFLIVGIFGFIFFSQTNFKIVKLYKTPIYIFSLIALSLVFIIGIESRGAVRWIDILGFRFQFSEILKPFLAVSFASYIIDRKSHNFRSLIDIFLLLSPIALLIFLQPDLGTALLYVGAVIATVIYLGYPFKYFFGLFLPLIALFPLIWQVFLS